MKIWQSAVRQALLRLPGEIATHSEQSHFQRLYVCRTYFGVGKKLHENLGQLAGPKLTTGMSTVIEIVMCGLTEHDRTRIDFAAGFRLQSRQFCGPLSVLANLQDGI
ncbi:hypothetical protein [Mycolicibacterium sp. CR10]|uniref:hypothetical protein n=1 Tax=Mycolicibacterium sp. CR10 TaxID=2562314 RepID=UPI0010BFFE6E|nr:hypothetical protein [Mycolicibacterium sp. CR10]